MKVWRLRTAGLTVIFNNELDEKDFTLDDYVGSIPHGLLHQRPE